MRDIYLLVDARHDGPFTEAQVRQMLSDGTATPDQPCWHDAGADCQPLGTLLSPLAEDAPQAMASAIPAGPALVRVEGVGKTFGPKTALHEVSFSVPSGQICGLLGPNGAGKTTLFRLLMGILKPTRGELVVGGLNVFEQRVEAKRLIGFLPDEPVFYSYLSGRETLALSAAMHGLDVGQTMARLQPVIQQMHLQADIDTYAEDYSRGMKKKLGLLLAMLHQPKVLILDEPTNGLDIEATHLFYELILAEAQRGTTVLFSTHLMDHVTKLCSHVVIINQGTVVAQGPLQELRSANGQASLEDVFLKLTSQVPTSAPGPAGHPSTP